MDTALVTMADNWQAHGWQGDRPDLWFIFPILWFLIIATAIFFAVRALRSNGARAGQRAGEARLAERFAAGEIDEEEYAARREVLRRQ